MKPVVFLLLVGWLVAGCAPGHNSGETATTTVVIVEPAVDTAPPVVETATNPPPTMPAPPATQLPATTTAATATAPSTAAAIPAATENPAIVYGLTDDGAFFHGQPDAPVTLIDYSDFL